MTHILKPEPLTAEAFAPYGDVIECAQAQKELSINYGKTTRFHNLMNVDVAEGGGKPCVSIFRSTPLAQPVTIKIMEYHPLGSQAFMPMGNQPYLVVVAAAGVFDAANLRVFLASPDQGVNYHKGIWHHFSLALNEVSDFLVIDRQGGGDNCVEHTLTTDEQCIIEL